MFLCLCARQVCEAGSDADATDVAQRRGQDGPLQVSHGANSLGTSLYDTFIRAGAEAGYGATSDYNGCRQEGCSPMPMTVFHSKEHTPLRMLQQVIHPLIFGVSRSLETTPDSLYRMRQSVPCFHPEHNTPFTLEVLKLPSIEVHRWDMFPVPPAHVAPTHTEVCRK